MNAASSFHPGRLEELRARIAASARRSGRSSDAVLLIGAVKAVPAEVVETAVAAGLTDLGENRVQEADRMITRVGRARARWHLIGHLQRNKAGRAATLFDRVHTVDDLELARALSRRATEAGRVVAALIQVNVSAEASKHGVAPQGLEGLLAGIVGLPGLRVDGLMSIGRAAGSAEAARPEFARTRELRDRAEAALGLRLPELSMGMSGDFEAAIEEGSTMVRLGTALFGPRG